MQKKKSKLAVGIIIILAVVVIGFIVISMALGKNDPTGQGHKYSVIPAGVNDLSKRISATGNVTGNGTVEVTSKLTAEISEVKVSLGDHVKKGDVLCVFDSTEIQEKYDELKDKLEKSDKKTESSHDKNIRDLEAAKTKKTTSLNRAQRELDKAISERDNAYKAYNDLVNEFNSHLSDPPAEDGNGYDFAGVDAQLEAMYPLLADYDAAVIKAQDSYDDTVEDCDEAIQAIQDIIDAEEFGDDSEASKQLNEYAEMLEQCTVTAPQDGVVTAVNVNEGTIPSAPSLMTIVNTDQTVIELTVKETDIVRINEGMSAIVSSNVLPGEEFPAKLTRIVNVMSNDAMADGASGYKVEVTLDTPNEQLLIGMSASVEITIDDVGEKISVPYSGIVEEDGKSFVYIAVSEGEEAGVYTAKKTEVTIGTEADFYTEITSGNISEGDLIIENPKGNEFLEPVTDGGRIAVK